MNKLTDQELLRDYAGLRSEAAFAELVRRHIDFVYSAALRMVRNAHLAEDVTQDVFVALAQNAPQLTERPVLSGWLHRTARNLAATAIRSDVRRRVREQEATTMNELLSPSADASWENIGPQLDAALGALGDSDRDALLLRYFERKSAQEMARILGLSNEAAQKRVNRAVERLRDYFSKRNLIIGASGLAVVMTANGVQAAPVALAASIATAAAGTAVHTSTFIAATKSISMTTIQKTFITAALAIVAGAGIYEARRAAVLREQIGALQQQQSPWAAQIQQLQRERDEAANRMASLLAQNEQMKQNQNTAELLKLRGEVGQLRQQLQGLPAARAALLEQKLAAMPDKSIPELKLLKAKDWENAAWNADLNNDDGVRVALRDARNKAVDTFFGLARTAIKDYLAVNNNILPSDLLPLKPYFSVPVTDDMLQRYAFMQTGALSANWSQDLLNEVAANVDNDYDSSSRMSMNGASGNCWNNVRDAISEAAMAFAVDNNGQPPADPSQIASYLKISIDVSTIQKYFGQVTSDIADRLPSAETATLAPAIRAFSTANNGQMPDSPSALAPYLTTPAQQAALQRLGWNGPAPK